MNLLYINACVREDSRTNMLAKYLLDKYKAEYIELCLNQENIAPLTKETLTKRTELINNKDYSDKLFDYAKQFALADKIIISAPYWDLSFPALLKAYFEMINITGITFFYNEQGIPQGLCKANEVIYITTSGGKILNDEYGYGYVKTLCETFYGINDIKYIKAENLDIIGANVNQILDEAKQEIDNYF